MKRYRRCLVSLPERLNRYRRHSRPACSCLHTMQCPNEARIGCGYSRFRRIQLVQLDNNLLRRRPGLIQNSQNARQLRFSCRNRAANAIFDVIPRMMDDDIGFHLEDLTVRWLESLSSQNCPLKSTFPRQQPRQVMHRVPLLPRHLGQRPIVPHFLTQFTNPWARQAPPVRFRQMLTCHRQRFLGSI